MSKVMKSIFSDAAYEALISGEAVDNNGFRSKNGNFYPDQPSFEPLDQNKEFAVHTAIYLARAVGCAIVNEFVVPIIKCLVEEGAIPCLSESLHDKIEKHNLKKSQAVGSKGQIHSNEIHNKSQNTKDEKDNVISLNNYRRMA